MFQVDLEAVWLEQVQQLIFRKLLNCTSLPGTIADLSIHLGKSQALIGVLATLLDNTVTLHDLHGLVSERDYRFLNSPTAPAAEAGFIVAEGAIAPDQDFSPNLGTLESPEFGATLILKGKRLGSGELTLNLTGPGISEQRNQKKSVSLTGFDRAWFNCRAQWVTHFPLGIDLILVDATQVMIIPRTTQIELVN